MEQRNSDTNKAEKECHKRILSKKADEKLLFKKIKPNREVEKIKSKIAEVLKKNKIKRAGIFGSYSRGEDVWNNDSDIHTSDIDIAIIGTKEKEIELTKFNRLLERDIIINFYPSFKKIHKHLKDNILNGILLSGSVDI